MISSPNSPKMPKPASKPIIAVDIDDVLAEHIEVIIEFSNKNFGTNFTTEDYLEQWTDLWKVSREEVERRAKNFHIPDIIGTFGVIEDALYVLNKLKDRYKLIIVTARPKRAVAATPEWIERNFPDIFSDIHFVPIWDPGPKATKAEICKKIGADYLIDDLVRHCNLAAEVGIQAVLFNRIKWKQPETPHPNVKVVNNWQEVLEYFNDKG
jgi:5'(3')-deoxyribonucleotidase